MIQFDYAANTVLVTGGSQGIGLGIASAFADSGAAVIITGTRAKAGYYDDDLSRFTYVQVNLSQPPSRQHLFEIAGPIDILVNNAGQGHENEYAMSGYAHVMEVNLTAAVELCYLYHDCLKERGGTIVNIGSCASFIATRQKPAYTASKAGLLGFTRAVADQWAFDGIRVNLVAPGFIATRMTSDVSEDQRRNEATLRAIPARRFGTPSDVAAAVLFLHHPKQPISLAKALWWTVACFFGDLTNDKSIKGKWE